MTRQRDLKRLVRARQERTGESYTTALRHVRGPQRSRVPVLELIDLTDIGAVLGIKCNVRIVPELAERIDVASTLRQLCTILVTTRQPGFAVLRSVVMHGERPFVSPPSLRDELNFLAFVLAGFGGVSKSGRMMAFTVTGRRAPEPVVFQLWMAMVRYARITPVLVAGPPGWGIDDPLIDMAAPGRGSLRGAP
jgi:hypothetical protein